MSRLCPFARILAAVVLVLSAPAARVLVGVHPASPVHAGFLETDYPDGKAPVVEPPPQPVVPPRPVRRPRRNELQALIDRITVGTPTHYRGLTVFPLLLRGAGFRLNALTLDEALARGELIVREWGRGQVRQVEMHNVSRRHVFVLEGEVLAGGYQDRIAAEDILLAPGQRVRVPVYCAERGRWDARAAGAAGQAALKAGKALAVPSVRRRLAESPSQDALWSAIRRDLAARGAAGRTERMASAYESPAYRREIGGYRRALKSVVTSRCAGVAIARGGRLVALDLFGEPRLATALWHKILDSHAASDIITHRPHLHGRIAPWPGVTRRHVERVLRRVYSAHLTRRAAAARGETLTLHAAGLRGRALAYRRTCVHAGIYLDEVVIQPMPVPRPRIVPRPRHLPRLMPPEEETPPAPRPSPREQWPE